MLMGMSTHSTFAVQMVHWMDPQGASPSLNLAHIGLFPSSNQCNIGVLSDESFKEVSWRLIRPAISNACGQSVLERTYDGFLAHSWDW